MVPILKEMDRRKAPYVLIHAGQHVKMIEELVKTFSLRQPDVVLDDRVSDVVTAAGGISWILRSIAKALLKERGMFDSKHDIVVVHGDAPPAFSGMVISKTLGLKLAHVEAGLRSYNFLDPFPEEFIRFSVDKVADFMFAPSDYAVQNLKRMRVKGEIFNTGANTVLDTLRLSLGMASGQDNPVEEYAVATIHRFETIHSKPTLSRIVDLISDISRRMNIVFVLHEPTMIRLKHYGLLHKLASEPDVLFKPLMVYPDFIRLINSSEFVVTDGGGLQEETCYLGKPCLIVRKTTERTEGLSSNVLISRFDSRRIEYFVENYKHYRSKPLVHSSSSPSSVIVEFFSQWN